MTLPSAPPAHTGAFGRLPHCWHSNDKVNIEPKILGVAGCGVAGRAQRGNSYLGPAWLYQGLRGEMAPPGSWGRNRLGVGSWGGGFFSSLSPLAERGSLT